MDAWLRAITGLLSLMILAVPVGAEARPARLTWEYVATQPPQHTGFLLRGCQPTGDTCELKDLRHVALDKREATVQVSGKKGRCFVVHAIEPTTLSAPSNLFCVSE